MAERRPLVLASAVVRELPSGDVVPVAAGGTGSSTADGARTNLGGVTAAHGFEGRSGSSLSMTGTVLTLSVPSSQVVWLDGVRYALTSDLTVDLGASPAVGNHYVVAQDDGNGALELSASQSAWSITNTSYTPCALIYWNGTAGAVMEERHGHDRNLAQHAYLHSTRGAAIENDGSFAQTRPTTTYDAQIELVAGSLWDEDIETLISTAQGKLCRHWYETASNTWTWVNGTDNGGYDRPFLWNSGTSRVQFPESDNSYALADAGPSAFVPVWVYASNDVTRPIYVVTPALTAAYNTLGTARAATVPVLPFTPELKLLYRWIIRGDGQYQEAADYRTSSSLPGGGVTAPTAASVSFNPSGDLAATNVQAALEELDTEKAPAAKGVTNGDSHDHSGGDGAQIAYSSLSGLPTLGTAAAAATTDFTSASFLQSGTGAVSRTTVSKMRDVVNVRDFGAVGDGVTNDQAAFQAAVTYLASVGCGVLEFDGVFKIDTPVTGISSNMTITGKGVSKIINGITSVRGTTDALFTGSGTLTNVGTITADLAENSDSATVSTPANFAVGDVICFTGDYVGRNISIVTKITDSVLSLDRSACNAIASGSTIWKMAPLRNTVIGNFDIDFNGTTASPRYGFGVVLNNSKDCRIENINSKFIGSKVAEISGGVDCVISNVKCSYGTDLAGDGGHSYLIRLSVCNDCLVEKCVGNYVRHTVDLSGASHNVVMDCKANGNYSTSFLSHGNNCKYNSFKNCTSVRSTTSGYDFDSAGGDTGNVIDGCATDDEGFFYSEGDGSNTVKNTVFKTTSVYALTFTGKQVFNNCTFYSSYPLIAYQNADTDFTFISCKFVLSGDKALGSLYSRTSTIRLTFINCDIDCSAYEAGSHFSGGSNTYLTFMGCAVTGAERDSSNDPLFSGVTKEINAYDSTFRFLGAGGYYFFGANSGTKITISNNRFINADYIIRRYTSADCSIVFGQNQFINSTLDSLVNFIGLSTIGAVDILLNDVPSTGTWIAGSKILFSTPAAGGDIGAVCTTAGTPGTWQTFG